jgi:AcrR family transcriptional regulator
MPKVSEEHRESRRDQITDAALRCFARKGLHRTSMADIIAESGLSAGALYLHFESKRDIALAASRRVMGRRLAELDALSEAGAPLSPTTLLQVMVKGLAADIGDTRVLVQLWGEATIDPEMHQLVGEVFGRLSATFVRYLTIWARRDRRLSEDEAAHWAQRVLPAMLAFGQGYLVQNALLPDFDSDRYFEGVDELFPG